MKPYELAVILHPDLEIDQGAPLSKIEKSITDIGGKVTSRDDWGKRKLAYPIAKQTYGIYFFYQLELPSDNIQNLEKNLMIADEVLRHLLVKPMVIKETKDKAKKPAKTAKPKVTKPKAAAKAVDKE